MTLDPEMAPNLALLPTTDEMITVPGGTQELRWLGELLESARPEQAPIKFSVAQRRFPGKWRRFEDRWQVLRSAGLIGV